MGKKKRKKFSKNKRLAWMGSVLGGAVQLFVKSLPLFALCTLLGFLFLGIRKALYADSYLSIRRIVLEPFDALPPQEKQEIESRWLGKNMLTVNLQNMSKELQKDPKIRVVRVSLVFPSILKIEIEKRQLLGMIQLSPRGSFGLVSEDGVIFEVAKERNPSFVLFEAYGWDQKEPRIGLKLKHQGFREAVKFLNAFEGHPLSHQETVTKIVLDRAGNVSLVLGGGPEIRLGRHPLERLGAMERVKPIILHGEGRAKIDYIDLEFDNIVVKSKK
jgi:cell division septal protein FtsQ